MELSVLFKKVVKLVDCQRQRNDNEVALCPIYSYLHTSQLQLETIRVVNEFLFLCLKISFLQLFASSQNISPSGSFLFAATDGLKLLSFTFLKHF